MVIAEDLAAMHLRYPKDEITLWGDGCSQAIVGKCKREEVTTRHQERS